MNTNIIVNMKALFGITRLDEMTKWRKKVRDGEKELLIKVRLY